MANDLSPWLAWLGHAILSNVIVASLLAVLATIVGWRLRRPAMAHSLWVLVLIKLVTPPIVQLAIPVPNWIDFSQSAIVSQQSRGAAQELSGARHSQLSASSNTPGHLVTGNGKSGLTSEIAIGRENQDVTNFAFVFLILSWLGIASFLMMHSLFKSIRFAQVLEQEGKEQADASKLGQQMAEACGIRKCPRIRLVSASLSPMLFGFSKWATIVIPSGLWSELNSAQRRAMLAHELSHFGRCDHWVRGLELIVGSLFFWFPLVRVARSQIERMEETCCDLNAVHALDSDRRLYAESLLYVVDYISQRGGRMPGFASGMRPTISLEERLRTIMNDKATGRMNPRHRFILSVVGSAGVLIHPLASASTLPVSAVNSAVLSDVERSQPLLTKESVPAADLRRPVSLPDVPRGWWNQKRQDSVARMLPIASGQKMRLRFNPGVFIDVLLADKSVHRLAESEPTAMVALQNGSRLIVGNGMGDIRLWDLESQQSVSLIGHHEGAITTLCYHPRFGLLSGDGNGLVLQWEIQSGSIQNSWSSHRGPIQSIRCDAVGDQVAVVFGDWRNHVEYSSLVFIDPSKWFVNSTMDVPVALATIFERNGEWQTMDWTGNVYPFPFMQRTGFIPKDDVSAIAFSQDTTVPIVQPASLETIPLAEALQ
jgi:bla regulator protein blaR1